eukprot:366007-Chlamydomonas_euryale.AAC.7
MSVAKQCAPGGVAATARVRSWAVCRFQARRATRHSLQQMRGARRAGAAAMHHVRQRQRHRVCVVGRRRTGHELRAAASGAPQRTLHGGAFTVLRVPRYLRGRCCRRQRAAMHGTRTCSFCSRSRTRVRLLEPRLGFQPHSVSLPSPTLCRGVGVLQKEGRLACTGVHAAPASQVR